MHAVPILPAGNLAGFSNIIIISIHYLTISLTPLTDFIAKVGRPIQKSEKQFLIKSDTTSANGEPI